MCLAALALFNGLHLGCAGIAARAAQRSTPPLISESLRTLNEPESRQLIGQIMTTPEVKEGTRRLAASLTSGVLSELTAEERQLARRSLDLGRMDNAQTRLAQAASYLNAVRPLALDVNPARRDRIKGELLVADLRSEDSPMGADRQLTELAVELAGLIGE